MRKVHECSMSNRNIEEAKSYYHAIKRSSRAEADAAGRGVGEGLPFRSKVYTDLEPIALPRDFSPPTGDTLEAVSSSECYEEKSPGLSELAQLLFFSTAEAKEKSAPIESCLVATDLPGLASGVYHFDAAEFTLKELRCGDYRPELAGSAGDNQAIAAAPVTLVFSGLFSHCAWRYQARAYRYCLWQVGVVLADLLAVAAAMEIPCSLEMGFVDAKVNYLLGLDGEKEGSLVLVPVGRSLDWAGHAVTRELAPLGSAVKAISGKEVDEPAVRRMHASSCLAADDEIRPWRGAYIRVRQEERGSTVSLQSVPGPSTSLGEVIQSRSARRRFVPDGVRFSELSGVLDHSTRGLAGDFMEGSETSLIDLYMVVRAVDGLKPGGYYLSAAKRKLELLCAGLFTGETEKLFVEEDRTPDVSTIVFFLSDLDRVLERFGNRGYRVAQVEAGAVHEKIRLSASALGLSESPLTVLEEEVVGFFSPHAQGKVALGAAALGKVA